MCPEGVRPGPDRAARPEHPLACKECIQPIAPRIYITACTMATVTLLCCRALSHLLQRVRSAESYAIVTSASPIVLQTIYKRSWARDAGRLHTGCTATDTASWSHTQQPVVPVRQDQTGYVHLSRMHHEINSDSAPQPLAPHGPLSRIMALDAQPPDPSNTRSHAIHQHHRREPMRAIGRVTAERRWCCGAPAPSPPPPQPTP